MLFTPLLHADIMYNVRYGWLDATEEEVKEAAHKANVHEMIERLPDELIKNINTALLDKARTSRFIAHKLRTGTVVEADLIIVLKEGELVEQGTHEELMRTTSSNY
ncbi:hypothetical protein BDZ97DRAFT_1775446, partial [Flammula alnicola]